MLRYWMLMLALTVMMGLSGCGGSSNVEGGNGAPIADAGTSQTVVVGTLVTLDGSGSSDPNNDTLTFEWSFESRPDGSAAVLSSATVADPSFTADVVGDYRLQLVVNDGRRNSAPAEVTIAATAAAAWQGEQVLAAEGFEFDLAANADTAILVWVEADYGSLHASFYDSDDDSWSAPVSLKEVSGSDYLAGPRVAINAVGDVVVVWTQNEPSGQTIHAIRFEAEADTWGAPQEIGAGTVSVAWRPHVALNNLGQAVAVWEQTEGSVYSLWANTFDGSWSTAQQINNGPLDAAQGKASVSDAGKAMTVWIERHSGIEPSNYKLHGRAFDFEFSTWGPVDMMDSAPDDQTYETFLPVIDVDGAGNHWVASLRENHDAGQRKDVWVVRFDAATQTWTDAEEIDGTDDRVISVQLAVDSTGNVTVIWDQYDEENYYNIAVAERGTAAGNWTAPTLLNGGIHSQLPTVGCDNNGNAIALWHQWNGVAFELHGGIRPGASGVWGPGQRVALNLVSPHYDLTGIAPRVAVFGADRGLAVWSAGMNGIMGSRLR